MRSGAGGIELGDRAIEKGWSCCHCGLNQMEMKLQKISVCVHVHVRVFIYIYTHTHTHTLYLYCMLHYCVVILHAWLLHFFTVLYVSYYGMVTYYPILFIFSKLITLFFIQHYIVCELFKIILVFYYKFVFANLPLF